VAKKKIQSVGDLKADPANVNKGTERGRQVIDWSLTELGAGRSILADSEGVVIAGNKTLEVAINHQLPVRVIETDGSELVVVQRTDLRLLGQGAERDKARQLAIADNRASEVGYSPDVEILLEHTQSGIDVSSLYKRDEIEALLASLARVEDIKPGNGGDDFDVTPEELQARVQYGDLWECGEHRVLCGDSTKAEDVARVMANGKATMCFTDPPWNVAIGKDSNPRHRQRQGLENDDLSPEDFRAFLQGFMRPLAQYLTGDLYCVLGASEWPTLDSCLRAEGFHWSATVIWVKDQFVLGRSKYHRRYEPIWYGWHAKSKSSFSDSAGRDKDDVWEIPRPRVSEEHPTMKPVELVERAVRYSSELGDTVFEPFGGSGTTLIACERTNRKARVVEVEPKYVNVIISRWEAETGKTAKLLERLNG
jgi:DNA modification methylase